MRTLNHPHPGTTIRDQVIESLGLTISDFAEKLGVSPAALMPVLNGQAPITDEVAKGLELAGFSTARCWMALQSEYDARTSESNAFGILAEKNAQNITLSIDEIDDLTQASWAGKKPR